LELPISWAITGGDGYIECMDYNSITESKINLSRGVSAFYVIQDDIKYLRLGFEIGGSKELIHYNFEPAMYEDSEYENLLINIFKNKGDWQIVPTVSFPDKKEGYDQVLNKKVTKERGITWAKEWAKNRKLPEGMDREIFAAHGILK
jgi:hypothetical protein